MTKLKIYKLDVDNDQRELVDLVGLGSFSEERLKEEISDFLEYYKGKGFYYLQYRNYKFYSDGSGNGFKKYKGII